MQLTAGTFGKSLAGKEKQISGKRIGFKTGREDKERVSVVKLFSEAGPYVSENLESQLELLNSRLGLSGSAVFLSTTADKKMAVSGNLNRDVSLNSADEIKLFSGKRVLKESGLFEPLFYRDHIIGYLYVEFRSYNFNKLLTAIVEANAKLISKDFELGLNRLTIRQYSSRLKRQKKETISSEEHTSVVMRMAAHDMSSPLNAIHGYLEMIDNCLSNNEDLQDIRKYHRRITSGISDISAILSQFEDITSIKDNGDSSNELVVNVNWMLQEIADFFTEKAKSKNLAMVCHTPDQPVYIKADVTRLKRSVVNLVTNAIKYSDKKGEVRIESEISGSEAVIRVIDQGIGIRKEKQKEVFKPFFQISEETHKKDPSSVGLGLYIVSNFVQQMNGRLELESEPGKGSSFSVILPVADPLRI
mgnify:CR=1 FL=1